MKVRVAAAVASAAMAAVMGAMTAVVAAAAGAAETVTEIMARHRVRLADWLKGLMLRHLLHTLGSIVLRPLFLRLPMGSRLSIGANGLSSLMSPSFHAL